MELVFTTVRNANLNTAYVSNELTLSNIGVFRTLTTTSGEILRNGVPSGQSVSVSDTDKVKISLTASSTNADSRYAVVRLDGEIVGHFQVITKSAVDEIYDPSYLDDLEITYDPNVSPSWAPETTNTLSVLNPTNSTITKIQVSDVPSVAPLDKTYIHLINHFADSIYAVDPFNNTIAQVISVGSRPYAGTYIVNLDGSTDLFVTNSGDGTISRIDYSRTVDLTFSAGSVPTALVANNSDLLVADFANGVVKKYNQDTSRNITFVTDYTVGLRPISFALDTATNLLWVVNSGDGTVQNINLISGVVSAPISLGHVYPTYCYLYQGILYVSCLDGSLVYVNVSTNTVVNTVVFSDSWLNSITNVGTYLYIADIKNNRIFVLNTATNTIIQTFNVDPFPFGLAYFADNNSIYIANYYKTKPSRYVVSDQSPTVFNLGSDLNVLPSGQSVSDTVTVSSINRPTPASINPRTSAVIFKNGSNVGQTTTVDRNDQLYIQAGNPTTFEKTEKHYLTIGDVTGVYTVSTSSDGSIPDSFYFTAQNGLDPDTVTTSNQITISGLATGLGVQISIDQGQLNVNGQVRSVPYTVFNGDTVSITLTSPSTYCDSSVATMSVGGLFFPAFVVTTKKDTTVVMDDSKTQYPPVYLDQAVSSANNKLSVFDVQGQNLTEYSVTTAGSTDPNSLNTQNPYLLLTDYYANKIHRIDVVTKQTVQSITSTKPISATYAPLVSKNVTVPTKLVVASGDAALKQVFVYSENTFSLEATIQLAHTPTFVLGGIQEADGLQAKVFFVSCFYDDTIYRIYNDGSNWITQVFSLPVGSSGPVSMFLASDNLLYVACAKSDQVLAYDVNNNAFTLVRTHTVGRVPWAVYSDGIDFWVSSAYNNEVERYSSAGTLKSTTIVGSIPYTLAAYGTSLYVANLYGNSLSVLDISGQTDVLSYNVSTSHHAYGLNISEDGQYVYIASFYDSLNAHSVIPNLTPLNFNIVNLIDQAKAIAVESNEITVSGVDQGAFLEVPNIYQSKIIKNGVDVGQSSSISNGDLVKFGLTTVNADYMTMSLPVVTCGQTFNWTVRTQPDLAPAQFTFTPIVDAYIKQLYVSNDITITNITPGYTTTATFPAGVIPVINGEAQTEDILQSSQTYQVSLNDTVALKAYAGRPYGATASYVLDIGGVSASFDVTSKALDGADHYRLFSHYVDQLFQSYAWQHLVVDVVGYDHTVVYKFNDLQLADPEIMHTYHLHDYDNNAPDYIHYPKTVIFGELEELIPDKIGTYHLEESPDAFSYEVVRYDIIDAPVQPQYVKQDRTGSYLLEPGLNPELYGFLFRTYGYAGRYKLSPFAQFKKGQDYSETTVVQYGFERNQYALRDLGIGVAKGQDLHEVEIDIEAFEDPVTYGFNEVDISVDRNIVHSRPNVDAVYERNVKSPLRDHDVSVDRNIVHSRPNVDAVYERNAVKTKPTLVTDPYKREKSVRFVAIDFEKRIRERRSVAIEGFDKRHRERRAADVIGFDKRPKERRSIAIETCDRNAIRHREYVSIVFELKQAVPWYDYNLSYTPDEAGYFASHEQAYQDAYDLGIPPSLIITGEILPTYFVWSQVVPAENYCSGGRTGYVQGG